MLFFRRELALAALPELGRRTRAALERLLPGGVTVLLPNPTRRFPRACGPDPDTLGLRVPALADALAPLHTMAWPVLQTSANVASEPAPRRVADVPAAIRAGVDCASTAASCPAPPRPWSTCAATSARGAGPCCAPGAVGEPALVRALDVEAP